MTDNLRRLIADLRGRLRDEVIGLALRGRGLEPGEFQRVDREVARWLTPIADEARAIAVAARAAAAFDHTTPSHELEADHDDTNDRTNDEEIDDEDPEPDQEPDHHP